MSPILQVILAGIGTFTIRYSAVALTNRGVRYPPWFEATLRLIAPSVLAAIAANTLILDDGELSTRWSWYAAAIIAAYVSWRWRSAGYTMLAGMISIWTIAALV